MSETSNQLWSAPLASLDGFYDLDTRLEQPFRDLPRPEGQLHAVVGGPKMGKTSLLNVLSGWLLREDVRSGRPLAPVSIRYDREAGDLDTAGSFLLCLVRNLREGLRQLGLCTISEASFASYFDNKTPVEGFRDGLNYLLRQVHEVTSDRGRRLGEVRLIGLIDDAEEMARLPWAPNLFGDLRALYNQEEIVRGRLDLVLAGQGRLARYFQRGAPWAGGKVVPLNPLSPGTMADWLQEASGGRLAGPLAQAVVAESGGQPYLARYFAGELAGQAERRGGWDRLPADQMERLASGFLQQHGSVLDRCLLDIQRADPQGVTWAACRFLLDAGAAGLDAIEIEDRLWKELGQQVEADQVLSQLVWRGVVFALPEDPDRFGTAGLFRRFCQQRDLPERPPAPEPEPEIWPVPAPRRALRLEYHELKLRLWADGGRYRVHAESLAEGSGEFENPLSAGERQALWAQVAQPAGEAGAIREMGQRLFHAVFRGDVLAVFHQALARAGQDPAIAGLRIKLVLDAPELHGLPWEFLYDDEIGDFLALYKKTPLVRYVEQPRLVPEFRAVDKLRLLAVVSSPLDQPPLNLAREVETLRTALEPWQRRGWLEYDVVQGREATVHNVQKRLRETDYHVFHFLGHGTFDEGSSEGMLMLERADGLSEALTATQLARMIGDERDIRLVFLNACETAVAAESAPFASVAGALVRIGVPAVVATLSRISDSAAASFAREFYQVLAEFLPVEAAVAEGRKQIDLAVDNCEWGVPILYLRAQDGHVFR